MKRTSKHTDVEEALDLLSTEVREEIQRIREEGAAAMMKGDLATARSVIDFAEKLEKFAGSVEKLMGDWQKIAGQHEAEPESVKAIVGKAFFGKARKGTITPNKDYYAPLLQALVNLGGSAKTQDAIDEVGRLMKGNLKQKDFELLKSEPQVMRWRNKVMWARNDLVKKFGHMKEDSPHGTWEISAVGRKWIAGQKTNR